MKPLLLASIVIVSMTVPALGDDTHHPAPPSQPSAPPATAPQTPGTTNAHGEMMADCPMMKDGKTMQGKPGTGEGQGATTPGTQGHGSGGTQHGRMMQDGKMKCPMMDKKDEGKPADESKPSDDHQSHQD